MNAAIILAAGLAAALLPTGTARADNPNKIVAQVILKDDGSRTDVIRNPQTRTLEMSTRDGAGNLSRRDLFKLNPAGEPLACQSFDGQGRLVYRTRFAYDAMGRKVEEATYNAKGKIVRRARYGYDSNGKAMKPQIQTFPDAERQPMAPLAPEITPGGLIPQSPAPKR